MSKLSFRARALDASKPMPIYLSEELPDLPEYLSINRAVPQMPSGMEKEEESVNMLAFGRHLVIDVGAHCPWTNAFNHIPGAFFVFHLFCCTSSVHYTRFKTDFIVALPCNGARVLIWNLEAAMFGVVVLVLWLCGGLCKINGLG